MTEKIVTPKPLPHNAIYQLAELLEHNFQCFRKHQPTRIESYTHSLKTAIGLGFTATLADSLYLSEHLADLYLFLDYFSTKVEHSSITPIALAAVKIIDTGAHIFRKQHFSLDLGYYNAFAKALKDIVQSSLLDSANQREESQCLLRMLLRSSLF